MDYTNFDLRLAGEAGAYTAEVLDAPAGQTSGPQAAAVRAARASPTRPPLPWPISKPVGRALWGCAFRGASGRAVARQPGGRRRRRPAPAADRRSGRSWPRCRGSCFTIRLRNVSWRSTRATPVVRYVRLPFAAGPWPQGRPLRLLCTAASPAGLPPLDVGAEAAALAQALAEPIKAGRLTHETLPGDATLAGLLAAVRRGR